MTSVLLALALSAANVVTPEMRLTLPTPGKTQAFGVAPVGQSWLEMINTNFSMISSHDHSPGHGAPLSSAAIGINAPLSFKGYDAMALRSVRFLPQPSPLILSSDIGALYVSGVDLYYNDTSGNQVRISASGGLAGTPGSIGGLASPAAVSYTPASKLYDFTSNSGVRAPMSHGALSIYDPVVSGKAATIIVPSGLASNYQLQLPGALPASTLPVTMTSAGALATAQITGAQIANATVTTANLAAVTAGGTTVATQGYIDARFVVSGRITGGTSTIAQQTGSVTVSVVHNSAGIYTVSVPGLTTGCILSVTSMLAVNGTAYVSSIATGSFVLTVAASGVPSDAADPTFTVTKL